MKKTPTYGLTHIAIAVRDLRTTKAFYQTVFDMEVMYEEAGFIQLNTPGTRDILVFEQNGKADGKSGGIAHFGFRLREPASMPIMERKILKAAKPQRKRKFPMWLHAPICWGIGVPVKAYRNRIRSQFNNCCSSWIGSWRTEPALRTLQNLTLELSKS